MPRNGHETAARSRPRFYLTPQPRALAGSLTFPCLDLECEGLVGPHSGIVPNWACGSLTPFSSGRLTPIEVTDEYQRG